MKVAVLLGVAGAVCVHAGFLAFGGLIFGGLRKDAATVQEVELLSAEDPTKPPEEKPEEPEPEEKPEELESESEAPPDAEEVLRNLEVAQVDNTPALDAASLSEIEAALNGQSGSGDFARALDFSSGGNINGQGKRGMVDEQLENAFSMAEIDQKPRAVFQPEPLFPSDLRGKKIEGVVTIVFTVDSSGKVTLPRVENSTHTSFDKPALDAVKKWKFEPAVRGGQRVACKMRVPIRFQPN